jgi:hypothetical protein
METRHLLPKSQYPKDKALVKLVPAKKVEDTDLSHKKNKPNEKNELILFNTEDIFKAKKHELF